MFVIWYVVANRCLSAGAQTATHRRLYLADARSSVPRDLSGIQPYLFFFRGKVFATFASISCHNSLLTARIIMLRTYQDWELAVHHLRYIHCYRQAGRRRWRPRPESPETPERWCTFHCIIVGSSDF